jgi:serine/threonine protein kinase
MNHVGTDVTTPFFVNVSTVLSLAALQNLLLSTKNRLDGTIKIIDFGCAVVSDDYLDNDDDETALAAPKPNDETAPKGKRAIKKASSTGTTAYWPPERFLGGDDTEATAAMDMWSVGVILYVRFGNCRGTGLLLS